MASVMKITSRGSHALASAAILSLLVSLPSAGGTAVPKAKPRSGAPKPIEPNNSVIPLPLMPVVSAGQRLCAMRTPSGLGYTMLRPASGAKPAGSDTALVNYIGYLAATGEVFDQGMRSPLSVDGVIPGFAEGLQLLAQGGMVRLCIPAAQGYGAQASGPIPANSDLVFQVELLDFKSAAEIEQMRGAQSGEPERQQGGATPQ